jgi:hypothetical protein
MEGNAKCRVIKGNILPSFQVSVYEVTISATEGLKTFSPINLASSNRGIVFKQQHYRHKTAPLCLLS